MATRWTPELLDVLRHVGDPWLDEGGLGVVLPGGPSQVHEPGLDTGAILAQNAAGNFEWPPAPADANALRDTDNWLASDVDIEDDALGYWLVAYEWQSELDRADVRVAQDLFVWFGQEIGASLLLASLPHSYAAESGAVLLAQSARLQTDFTRRVGATAQFLLQVMIEEWVDLSDDAIDGLVEHLRTPGHLVDPRLTLLPGGQGHIAARRTRLIHAVIRQHLAGLEARGLDWGDVYQPGVGDPPIGTPIHQEHLLGTYLSFCVTVWQSLERLGVRWTSEEKEAYFRHWDWIAHLMGIGHFWPISEAIGPENHALIEPFNAQGVIRPADHEEAEELLAILRDRNWPAAEETLAFQNAAGKQLVRALLDDLEDAVPALMQPVPAAVMRYLADERVTVALGLGGGGLPPMLLDWSGNQSRVWNRRRVNLLAPAMRFAATQVCLHAFTHFMREGGLELPGVEASWTSVTNRSRKESKKALAGAGDDG